MQHEQSLESVLRKMNSEAATVESLKTSSQTLVEVFLEVPLSR